MQISVLTIAIGLTSLVSSTALPDIVRVPAPRQVTQAPPSQTTPASCNPGSFRCQGKNIVCSPTNHLT